MKVTPSERKSSITFQTKPKSLVPKTWQWWKADSDKHLAEQVVATAAYIKENQSFRYRQLSIYARLYGNMSLMNYMGSSVNQADLMKGLPADRPTFNLIQSATDTLVSKISQAKPSPVFLTDNSDYRERRLAKQLNNFILGEFYQTKTYDKVATILRDALVTGTGVLKVFETQDKKVGIERVLNTEILVDYNDALYGEPRSIYQIKLIDRNVLREMAPKYKSIVDAAEGAVIDNASASDSVSDQVLVVEAWHLKSGEDAKDGRHTIACSAGIIEDEQYDKPTFPFVFLNYSPRLMGFWAQGLAEQLMGTQVEINSLLFTISKAIKLVGVPRVFIEMGSKVVSAHQNNDVGTIIKYQGTKPIYEVAPCVPQEMYAQLQRLIDYGYQQCGVSTLDASAKKPAGLNSGEAIRSYDDISTDRSASLSKRYDNVFIDLAYLIVDKAKDIADRDGKYQTVYPNKNGAKEIDLPKMSLIKDPFVIQVFNMSSLPRDPAGRMQKVTEMIQSGMVTIQEGRRLLDYPDLDQVEKLANASQERIYQIMDEIVEEGKYSPPDPFMDIQFAEKTVVAYYNLYVKAKLEEERAEMLRTFYSQVQAMKMAAQPPVAPQGAAIPPQATPQPLPQSDLVPNANQGPSSASAPMAA